MVVRRRQFRVSMEVLHQLFGLPADVAVVHAISGTFDGVQGVAIYVDSPEFEVVPEGTPAPLYLPTFLSRPGMAATLGDWGKPGAPVWDAPQPIRLVDG